MKNTDNLSTTHFQIYDYWKDKYICRDGTITEDGSIEGCIPVVEDDYEPMCWGCKEAIIGNYEKKRTDCLELKGLWNDKKLKSKLERCHIKPRTLGGGVEPSNLFLMCHGCHFESPDTSNSKAFFRWVYKQRATHVSGVPNPQIIFDKMNEELESRGLPDLFSILKTIPQENACEFMKNGYKSYFDENVALHSIYLVESSVVVGMTDYFLSEVERLGGQVVQYV